MATQLESVNFYSYYCITLLASWLNIALFMIEIVLAIYYLTRGSAKSRKWFGIIVFILVNDTVCTGIVCARAWLYLINWGRATTLPESWHAHVILISSSLSAAAEQLFLIRRVYPICCPTKQLYPMGLFVPVAIHVIATTISSGFYIGNFQIDNAFCLSMVALCICTAMDIVIPALFIWELYKISTTHQTYESLVRRVSITLGSSGFVVTLVSILMLVFFWIGSDGLILISNPLGRLYSLTIFFNIFMYKRNDHAGPTTCRTTGVLSSLESMPTRQMHCSTMGEMPTGCETLDKDESLVQTSSDCTAGKVLTWKSEEGGCPLARGGFDSTGPRTGCA